MPVFLKHSVYTEMIKATVQYSLLC